jgi:hypothetical protein
VTDQLGTIIYDEQIFTITSITLRDGLLWFNAQRPGPASAPPEGEFRVHGPDSKLVLTVYQRCDPYETQHATAGGFLYLPLALDLSDTGWPTPNWKPRD